MQVDRQQENGFMRHNQNRRSRGRNNRKGPNPLTRSYESNGPDVKVRGTAAHVADKYMTLARDAQSSGDTVAAENYLQHAEHYYRIVMAAQAQFQPTQPQFREGGQDESYDDDRNLNGRVRDRFDFNGADGRNGDGDDEGYDNGGEGDDDRGYRPPMQQQAPRQQEQDNRPRGPRPEQRYDNRPRQDNRPDNRQDARQDNRQDNRPDNRQDNRQERNERPDYRDNGNRQERFQRAEEPQPEIIAPVEAVPPPQVEEAIAPPRRRRGRPPRVESEAVAPPEGDDATPDGAAALAAFPD